MATRNRNGSRSLGGLWLVTVLALTAPVRAAWPSQPPSGLPKGAIVAFLPDAQSKDYADAEGLKRWLREQGWALCDGGAGTPDLNYRMLLGTVHPEEAGRYLGSRTHNHRVGGDTGTAYGGEQAVRTGLGFALRLSEEGHRHKLAARTDNAEHLPLSMRVVYIIKID